MRQLRSVLAVLVTMAFATSAFAGFGFHVGLDMTQIDETTQRFYFEGDTPSNTTLSTLERDASGKPLNIGVDLTFSMLPMVDLQASLEGAFANYKMTFVPGSVNNQNQGASVEEDVPYLRVGGDVSAFISPVGFPPGVNVVKWFIGGGLSVHLFQPAVSKDMLLENVTSVDEEIDPVDYVNTDPKFGFHVITGLKIKPPALPLGFRVTGKYYIFTGQDPDTPANFLTLQAGVYFGMGG